MKTYTSIPLALLAMLATGCDLDVGSGTSASELEAARQAASTVNTTQNTPVAEDTRDNSTGAKTAEKPAAPAVTPTPTPAPAPAPTAPVVAPINTGGALYQAGGNTLTLRSDFAAVAGRVDALVRINDSHHPGSKGPNSSTAVAATRSGNTWILPQALASYPTGNVPNTWRIVLTGTPPAGVTYHTSISQTFIRTSDFGTGKTYPPTTRR